MAVEFSGGNFLRSFFFFCLGRDPFFFRSLLRISPLFCPSSYGARPGGRRKKDVYELLGKRGFTRDTFVVGAPVLLWICILLLCRCKRFRFLTGCAALQLASARAGSSAPLLAFAVVDGSAALPVAESMRAR